MASTMANDPATEVHGDSKPSVSCSNYVINTRIVTITLLILGVGISCWVFYNKAYAFQFLPRSYSSSPSPPNSSLGNIDLNLQKVLEKAATRDKTVIITTVNQAWAASHSIFDVFLESFRIGNGTFKLLNHMVVVSMDHKAYERCLTVHPHCYALRTKGINFSSETYFMTPNYLDMMWRRTNFLASILEMGYNFVFTDTDIMWLQDPFRYFFQDADFQIACDQFNGNSYDKNNSPNGGFMYVKSNNRTIQFYKFWCSSRKNYPGKNEQDVFNKIKKGPFIKKIGLEMRFLSTAYFGGFCEHGKDFNLMSTMHANCCFGLANKLHDLKILLADWRRFLSLPPSIKALSSSSSWRVPQKCK
ncbi:Nucleotid_trans domain-containing protein [Cephalotus follicularis]|uniref:Glycosyltransferase n=1 Tax=Cephalotus follicularis TaxID=3775 RepID=A0A1Q3C5L1_CEPFO|nr:Nucleotid_trans domain-containing protein [Cephalotus follicularis]